MSGKVCPCCEKAVYFAEEMRGNGQSYHRNCFRCKDCRRGLDSTNLCEKDHGIYCKSCYGKRFGPKGYGYGAGAGVLSMDTGKAGETPDMRPSTGQIPKSSESCEGGCPRCGCAVFKAERIVGSDGQGFHRHCFTCCLCNKRLDSTTVADHGGEIYCKGCYGKEFGPKGFGYGLGAGALTRTQ